MINIAILGFGVVGGGIYTVISEHKERIKSTLGDDINIKYILDLREFKGHPLEDRVIHDIKTILDDKSVTVVAETMGGDNPAYDFSLACLRAGKSVVTSNKLVVEKHGEELTAEAEKYGVKYMFEASVGGGIPVLHPLNNCLFGNNITRVRGILNGTTNFILERMENSGCSFEDALAEAQSLGYAEANPVADVEGLDAARKICILASLSFGKWFHLDDCTEITGISGVTAGDINNAKSAGSRIKLIGEAIKTESGISLSVKPTVVTLDDLLWAVSGVFNCIVVTGDAVGDVAFYGHGAGGVATASAVVSDIIECAK